MKLRTLVAAFAAVLAAGAAVAEPSYTSQITIGGYAGDETLENFPVLVRIKADQPKGFAYSQCQGENGADISFTDAAGNVIPHEIDTWNPDGESTVWVKVPSVTPASSGATTFNFRWCDSAATESTSTSNTWDSSYVMVFHMGEESGTCANSAQTGSKYDAEPKGTTTDNKLYSGDDAPVGGARTVSTSSSTKSALKVPSYDDAFTDSDSASVFTWSAWCRQDVGSLASRVFVRGSNYEPSSWALRLTSGRTQYVYGSGKSPVSGPTLPLQSWAHVVLVYNGTTVQVYNDGELKTTGTISAATKNGQALGIGNGNAAGTVQFVGAFDECRLMKGAASAAWVKAEYDTVKTAGFLTYGDATKSGEEPLLVGATLVDDSVKKHEASVQCAVLAFGPGATSATVKLLYWIDGDTTTNTVDVGSLTEKGSLTANLTGLHPQTTYCAKAVVMNNAETAVTEESSVVTFTTDTYLPSDSIALGGVGGDTITVGGTVEAFDAGKTCTLTVLTGDSETTITNEWSGLAGSTLSADADSTEQKFSFSLCETDATSPRYIEPGSTVYVAVKAKIGDWVMQSPAKAVTTKEKPTMGAVSAACPCRSATFSVPVTDIGMTGGVARTTLSLYIGTTQDVYDVSTNTVEVTEANAYAFEDVRVPTVGVTYYYKIDATNVSAGGTTNMVVSKSGKVVSKDSTTYTWTGVGGDCSWTNAANWSHEGVADEDCFGYPKTADASVAFAEGAKAEITLDAPWTLTKLDLSAANVDVTFVLGANGVARDNAILTATTLDFSGANGKLTLDGTRLATSAEITLGTDYTLVLTNAAYLGQNGQAVNFNNKQGGTVLLSGESTLDVGRYYMDNGARTVLRDAYLIAYLRTQWWNTDGKIPVLRFEGKHPKLTQTSNWFSAREGTTANLRIEFCVPAGGYDAAPLYSTGGTQFGSYNKSGTESIYVETEGQTSKTVTTPLISWKNGIYKTGVSVLGKPKKSAKVIWADATGAETTSDSPNQLNMELPGSAGFLLIIR